MMRKKNRDYSGKNKTRLRDRLPFGRRKSNRDIVLEQAEQAKRRDDYYSSDGSQDSEMEPEYIELERSPRTDLSKVKKLESIFVPRSGRCLRTNRYMLYTSFMIIALFAGLIVYLVHFTIYDSSAVITSPYNKRTTALAENIKKGSIKSANDKILASTKVNDEGDEYRYYPYENMFAHVVGYNRHGKGGLESSYNYEMLTSHEKLLEQFKKGITGKKNTGDTLYTTLDTRLQKRAYQEMEGRRGSIIAIEPKTGRVRAMVSKPDFDPNTLDEDWEDINTEGSSILVNRAISGMYPPGSTYKTLTALEYIEENPGTYQNFKYKCKGETIVNSVRIKCYGGAEHGKEDLSYAFAHSCNTAFVTIGSKLNLRKFINLNQRFLFDSGIPFDLPVKRSRLGLNIKSDKSQIPQASIGQGDTLVTPFHNALIMCAVANDGVLMKPTLVDHIESADGSIVSRVKPEKWKRLADDSDAKIMQKLLREVVTEGTGRALKTDKYTVAGKTGTAEHGGDEDHSWFVGFSNIEDPDLVVCVLVENGGAGSEVAAPIADEIFDSYYENEMYKDYRKGDNK
ncbi:MAG: penicillin-binding protein 2 [Eubacterium sp.]|nr:penicillin-binding protein 2 [Eubacterium sp.]